MTSDRRMMLVHAHPDDESINNGATMARYADDGASVTLVTCTAGEMGEVLVPDLAYLAYDQDGGLGEHRRGELAEAMKVLGVTDHRFLGGFGRFHDSGMAWHEEGYAIPAEVVPDNAFWNADLTEAADELVKVIREVRPQVLVTYDQFGGYGHPDHIQAHRVAMYGAMLAAAPSYKLELGLPHDVAKIYWTAMSESRMRESLRRLREAGDTETFAGMEPDGKLPPFVTPDELISARIDGTDTVQRKMDALARHETQVQADGPFFAGAESGHSWWAEEFYRLVKGTPGPVDDQGFEDDLFAGL
jgi:N-acetyl-1-D-myo-inositol-2-amino-2-deoxy-alpha-D-glucopyranoside deacetylase